jgi:PhzF family phenazine biosynthesis protein
MKFWQVDAFTNKPFRGNPAAVVILDKPLPDEILQDIAAEMNLSETAFILAEKGLPLLRWFTPKAEVDLCGHATLAAAHIYLSTLSKKSEVSFATKFVGPLTVSKKDGLYTMNFPSRPGEKIGIEQIPGFVLDALAKKRPSEAFKARDLMLVYDEESVVTSMDPDFSALKKFPQWIIVTSRSKKFDFISRFFCAGDGIDEDPVTGSAHCTSIPYWAHVLGKNKMRAYQASARGGDLSVELSGDRVFISGEAVTVLEGVFCRELGTA